MNCFSADIKLNIFFMKSKNHVMLRLWLCYMLVYELSCLLHKLFVLCILQLLNQLVGSNGEQKNKYWKSIYTVCSNQVVGKSLSRILEDMIRRQNGNC